MGTTENILKNSAVPNLSEILDDVTSRELQTALITDSARRAGSLAVSDVIHQYENDGFVEPCELSQRDTLRFGSFIADTIPPNFDMVEMSPVAAFGSNSVLANVSQKTVLTTSRNTEVVADGVTSLTLEAALRRRNNPSDNSPINLSTIHRELRTQKHEQPGFTSHFQALSLISSERTPRPDDFKSDAFTNHVAAYIDIIKGAEPLGYKANNISIALSNIRIMELLMKNLQLRKEEIMRHTQTPGYNVFDINSIDLPTSVEVNEAENLANLLPEELRFIKRPLQYMSTIFGNLADRISNIYGDQVHLYYDLSRYAGVGYYKDLCVKITASNKDSESYPLVDIGSNDWLARVTHNKQDRLVTGGMGTELFMKKFKA